jgi:hypothetical protein
MHARVTQWRVLPGKLSEFTDAVKGILPAVRSEAGFCGLVVLRTAEDPAPQATVISLWDSLEHLKASETNIWSITSGPYTGLVGNFFYEALRRVLAYCEEFPKIREHEVLTSELTSD